MHRTLGILVLSLVFASWAAAQGLTVWTSFEGPMLTLLREDAEAFSSTNGIDVEIVSIEPTELGPRIFVSTSDGETPDVIVGLPHDQIGTLVEEGVLADLSSVVTDSYLADLSAPSRLAFGYAGGLYGLPLFVEGPALLYNRALVSDVPETYGDFIDLAQVLTNSDTFGFLYDINNFYFSYAWFRTFGGYVFGRIDGNLDPNDVGLANAGAVEGAEALRALRFDAQLVPSDADYELAKRLFEAGALAMTYNGKWGASSALEAGIDVGIAPMPNLADGTPWSGFMGAEGVLVSAFSDEQTRAVNLAKWFVRAEAQLAYARLAGRVPASELALSQLTHAPLVQGFGQALRRSEPIPNIPAMRSVWGPMASALEVLVHDEAADVKDVLDSAVDQIVPE